MNYDITVLSCLQACLAESRVSLMTWSHAGLPNRIWRATWQCTQVTTQHLSFCLCASWCHATNACLRLVMLPIFFGRRLIISLTQWDNQTAWPPEEKFEISFRSVVRVLSSELLTTLWCHVYCNDMISWQALTHKGTYHFFFLVSSTILKVNFHPGPSESKHRHQRV